MNNALWKFAKGSKSKDKSSALTFTNLISKMKQATGSKRAVVTQISATVQFEANEGLFSFDLIASANQDPSDIMSAFEMAYDEFKQQHNTGGNAVIPEASKPLPSPPEAPASATIQVPDKELDALIAQIPKWWPSDIKEQVVQLKNSEPDKARRAAEKMIGVPSRDHLAEDYNDNLERGNLTASNIADDDNFNQ